jgi:NAD(P)-dependent dehydrogenase (short-subunit alcohol dehydrogenase family)
MQTSMQGKVVVITGAARGLGRATALAFANAGASLFLVDVLEGRLKESRDEVAALGVACDAFAADLASGADCAEVVRRAVARHGRLDVLCNVAGVFRFHHVRDVTPEEWERIFAVNVRAPFLLSQAAIPHLLASRGNIVNVASSAAFIGEAYCVPYAASKAALVSMTRSMAMEFARQEIRINAVAPGGMNTEIAAGMPMPENADETLLRYFGLRPPSDPDEIAQLILYVASECGRSIHGACLSIDGGVTAG